MLRIRPLLWLLILLAPALAAAARAEKTIYVTSNGWHSGIVIARAAIQAVWTTA